jgi:hypothetical protein
VHGKIAATIAGASLNACGVVVDKLFPATQGRVFAASTRQCSRGAPQPRDAA